MKPLIDVQTASATQSISIGASRRVTISAGALAGAETVTFLLDEEGVAVQGLLYQDDSLRRLTATNNAVIVDGPIDLVVVKSATALPVGVFIKG